MNEFYYKDALKLGQKEARARTFKGQSPCLPVLEDFVSSAMINTGIDLGLVQIPAELIVGTKTRGRVNAFAPNFMPVLDETTEFADKWERLCQAHVTEGIRDPIKAYEYMNRFYVEEGNKRVSVLKFFDAVNIVGHVIRIMPTGSGDEVDLYNEFLDFYKLTKINFLEFTKKGSYALLQKALGKAVGEDWTEDEISRFTGTYYYFKKAYIQNGGEKLQSTVGDAMLSYIMVYGYHELKASDPADIKKNLSKMWQEVELHAEEEPIEVKTEPAEEKKKGVISKMISAATTPSVLSVAFIHDGTPERSGWIHDHEKGRKYVERIFEDKIVTTPYYNAMENDALKVIELAIEDGAELIFTTSPRLAQASLRAAVEHPEISIMNCSLNKSHRYISSYYTRMYEAKFILGAIAGSLTKSDKLGYVCDYPIYGQIAAINAFALGAQMANPRAKVYLEWRKSRGYEARRAGHSLYLISGHRALPRGRPRNLRSVLHQRRTLGAYRQPRLEMGRLLRADPPPLPQQDHAGGVSGEQQGAKLLLGYVRRSCRRCLRAQNGARLQTLRGFPARRNHSERLHPLPHSADKAERRDYRRGSEIARSRPDHQHGLPRRERDRHDPAVRRPQRDGQGNR